MDSKLQGLLKEIQRQLESIPPEPGHNSDSARDGGAIRLQQQGNSYKSQLVYLHQALSSANSGSEVPQDLPPSTLSCLWKIPAFCRPNSAFLHPLLALKQCLKLQAACGYSPSELYTDDVWESPQLRGWAAAEESSLMLVQGSYESINRLDRFTIELCDFLSERQPTMYMVRSIISSEYFADSDDLELLKQLAIQALERVPMNNAVFFFADMAQRFLEASTSEDWFKILECIFQWYSSLFVVVNVSVLNDRAEKAKTWPNHFQQLIARLQTKTSTCLRILLVSIHPIWVESKAPSVMLVGSIPEYISDHEKMDGVWDAPPVRYLPIFVPTHKPMVIRPKLDTAGSKEKPAHTEEKQHRVGKVFLGTEKEQLQTEKIPPEAEKKVSQKDEQPLDIGRRPPCNVLCKEDLEINEVTVLKSAQHSKTPQVVKEESDVIHTNRLTHQNSLQPDRRNISVAIICALTLEADAVEALFDEQQDISKSEYSRTYGDINTYSIGVIGRHRVVLVHMPSMGNRHAAAAAAYCTTTFPNISLALVVGICGGVPFTTDDTEIVLGDVAISEGLVLYDFGRQFPDGFSRKAGVSDCARKLPLEIMGFLAKLKGRKARKRLEERTYLHLNTLSQKVGDLAIYPGVAEDKLFESAYRHKHQDSAGCVECAAPDGNMGFGCALARNATCEGLKCDHERLVTRKRHEKFLTGTVVGGGVVQPAVHFGVFASGDKVMKSGEDRDRIARIEGIIAFEMEGAGAWDILPCLIIKGICDYADSHKSKRWQDYAAATAAACTKAFLEEWPVRG